MRKKRNKTAEQPRTETWNQTFAKLLEDKNSPALVRPTSEAIAKVVTRRLKEKGNADARISKALVQKWRSQGSGNRVPSNKEVAHALVSALDEIGLFTHESKLAQKLSLLKPLGFELPEYEPDLTVKESYARAWREFEDRKFHALNLNDQELLIVTACLMSQHLFDVNLEELKKTQGRIVLFLLWDRGSSLKADQMRKLISEELINNSATAEFLAKLATEYNVKADIVFGVRNRTYGRNEQVNDCALELSILAKALLPKPSNGPVGRGGGKINVWDWKPSSAGDPESKAAEFSPYMWIHLYPGGLAHGWQLVRNSELFKKTNVARAATFASPIEQENLLSQLRELGFLWNHTTKKWDAHPGEQLTGTYSQTHGNV